MWLRAFFEKQSPPIAEVEIASQSLAMTCGTIPGEVANGFEERIERIGLPQIFSTWLRKLDAQNSA